jgi:YfiH family protein
MTGREDGEVDRQPQAASHPPPASDVTPASHAAPHSRTTPQWLIPDWPAPPGVRALSTLRVGGSSRPPYASLNVGGHVGDAPIAVAKNRRSLREAAGLPAEPSWLTQVHGIRVADLDAIEPDAARAPESATLRESADAVRVCAILTADCLPILLAAVSGGRVGAAHAGWRGLAAGVIEAAVAAMGVPPQQILAWLGPAIGPLHFEIGPEVREALLKGDPGADAAFVPSAKAHGGAAPADAVGSAGSRETADRYMADLYALARRRLHRLGIERIYGGTECTFSRQDRYFSHRRDGQTGRQASLIWLEDARSR